MKSSTATALVTAVLTLSPIVIPLFVATQDAAAAAPPGSPTFSVHPFTSEQISPKLGIGYYSSAGEPSIGVNWDTGNVLFQADHATMRVVFDDTTTPPTATWQDVSSIWTNQINIDPILHTDSKTGVTFAGGLNGACSVLARSSDDGQSWDPVGDACTETLDHESVVSGPWKGGVRPAGAIVDYGVYYCGQLAAVHCWRSLDGGITWTGSVPVTCGTATPGAHGSLHVDPAGNVYLPFTFCNGGVGVSVSRDNGLTWSGVNIPGTTTLNQGFDADIATSDNGRVWIALPQNDGFTYVSWSDNQGVTWTPAKKLGATEGLTQTTFQEMIAGDADRAAIAFLGSTTDGDGYRDHNWNGVYYLYTAYTYDAGATWTIVRASDDPVQRGCIWDAGGDDPCRNLLDFMDAQVDKQGRVVVGFADGCVAACAGPTGTKAQSTSSWPTLARQSSGRGLFAAYDESGPALLSASAGGPYTGIATSPVALAGSAAGGTAPYTYAWSVVSKPVTSNAGPTSFGNAGAAVTTFTPDVPGAYSLRLTVTDSAAGSAVSTATLSAADATGTCGAAGTVLDDDSDSDGGTFGSATEIACFRVKDDASAFTLFADLKGTGVTSNISASTPLFYDFYFTKDAPYLIEVTWDGTTAPTAAFVNPINFLPIPGKTATAAFEGSTLRVQAARGEIVNAPDGSVITDIYLDLNSCVGQSTSCTPATIDRTPDSGGASYTLGDGPGGEGQPIPLCSAELAADAAADDTATTGRGRRDIRSFATSDDDMTWTFCINVANFADGGTGTGTAADTRFAVGWDAPYEGPGISYSVRVVYAPNGDQKSASALKGVAGSSAGLLATGVTVSAARDGDQVRLTVVKSQVGAPADTESATNLVARAGDDSAGGGVIFDRAPNTGGASFVFGQKVVDTTPPSQVTGLAVTDPVTGSSLNLAWSAATDDKGVASYTVQRSLTPGGPYATIGTPTSTSFSDTGLTAGTTYHYVVFATDTADNDGPRSAEASGTPTAPPPDTTVPTDPTNIVQGGTTTTEVTVSWTSSIDPESGIDHYNVWLNGVAKGAATTTSFTVSGLEPDTAYLFAVSAVNGAGLESGQVSATVKTLPLPPPDCGQAGFEVATDGDFDASDGLRSDLVRISANESADHLTFRFGVRDMSEANEEMYFQVEWLNGNVRYSAIASVTDAGASAIGVYTGAAGAGIRASEDITTEIVCDSLLMGIRWSDIGVPSPGTTFTELKFNTQIANTFTTSEDDIHDRAPNTGGVAFIVGSSNIAPVIQTVTDQVVAEDSQLLVAMSATDAENDAVTWSLANAPAGMTMVGSEVRWKPSFSQAGSYPGITVIASDGKGSSSTTFAVTVTNVDRAVTLQPLTAVTVLEAKLAVSTLRATDVDGDAIVLASPDLPAWATLVDNADGTGRIDWRPTAGTSGTYTVNVTATAGGATATRTVSVTVKFNAAMTLVVVGSNAKDLSPGEAVTLTARITNKGPATDTFSFTAGQVTGWSAVVPGPVTLGPGESTDVVLQLTAPAAGGKTFAVLTARSAGTPTVVAGTFWSLQTPVTTTIAWDQATFSPDQTVTGVVKLSWKDGSAATGVVVTATQSLAGTPDRVRAQLSSSTTMTTGADGKATVSFGDAPLSRTPGQHAVTVTFTAGGQTWTVTSAYTVG